MTIIEYNKAVKTFADNLYRFLLKSTGNKADAEDLVQITFEKLWINRKKVRMESIKAYLFKVGYNAMIDRYRKIRRLHFHSELPEKSHEPAAYNIELQELLHNALNKLSNNHRAVVLLRDYEGYTYQEISDITGLSLQQVKVYIFRARRKMRTYLQPYYNSSNNEQQHKYT